ncbi:MAG TPA: SDR family oxidoreductase, partial [Tepidiformaceae bacterium]|nr:SDR family oxidoreductase [Tepidiformaceae bacterium]
LRARYSKATTPAEREKLGPDEARNKLLEEKQPSLDLATPEQLGGLAVFLCSEASSYITGEIFVIDGGGLAGGIAPMGHTAGGPANG